MSILYRVARPRVILACNDAEAAVRMIGALNPKRYRVEHIFDLSEALLRSEIVLAHSLVIYTRKPGPDLLRQCRHSAERVTPVIVSPDPEGGKLARSLDGRYVPEPFDVADFKRAVYRAVSRTEERRQRARVEPRESQMRSRRRVLLLCTSRSKGSIMAAVLQGQLHVTCEVATSSYEAMLAIEGPLACIVAEPELLMQEHDGLLLARELSRRGVPLMAVKARDDGDVAEAAQAAWDVVPQLRRSLTARDKPRAAV
jgi:hypothetical protein